MSTSTGKFIVLVNKWFDILNSYSPINAYGFDEEKKILQNEVLVEMRETISKMTIRGKKSGSLEVFQKGNLLVLEFICFTIISLHLFFTFFFCLFTKSVSVGKNFSQP